MLRDLLKSLLGSLFRGLLSEGLLSERAGAASGAASREA